MGHPAAPERFYLGIDGGGTKTRACVVDASGVERATATSGGSNYKAAGVERAAASLRAAAQTAADAAGARLPFTAAWLGVAGVDGPVDIARLQPHVRTLASAMCVTNDAELLLSALPDQIGIALIAGTGSIAVGRGPAGVTLRVGGWGHVLGDEGSAYDLGRRALNAAARAADGRGQPTRLLDRILDAWGLNAADELLDHVYRRADKGFIAQLAPLTLQVARDGDAVARRITRRATLELARAALTLADRLAFDAAPLPLAFGGSLLLRDPDFRAAVAQAITRRRLTGDVALVEQPALSAARAALRLAAPSPARSMTPETAR